jgi:hypothetical protein
MTVATAAHALLRVFRGHVARQYVWAVRYVTDPSSIALAFASADDNSNGIVEPCELAALLVLLGGYSAAALKSAQAHAQVGGAHVHGATQVGSDWIVSGPLLPTNVSPGAQQGAGSVLVDMARLASEMGSQRRDGGVTVEQFCAWWMQHVPSSSRISDQLALVAAARSLYTRSSAVLTRWRQLVRASAQAQADNALLPTTE